MAKRLLLLLFFMVILSSCRTGNNVIVVPTITSIATVTSTMKSTATTTISPNAMSYQCLEVAVHPPSNYVLKGTLVFNNHDNTESFLWNNDTKNTYQFQREKGDRLLEFKVSPDRKHIMYQHYSVKTNEQQLVIATADGQQIWSQVVDSYLWDWFDNEYLISLYVPQNGNPSLFLLNPFSSVRKDLQIDYPDSQTFSGDWFPSWNYTGGGLPVYDPTLTRVVYPECNSECQARLIRGDHGRPIALRDAEKDQVITRIVTMDNYGGTPLWTPDGKRFLLATNIDPKAPYSPANEIFAVSRDGHLEQLTYFKDQFAEVNIPDNYSMSPDGKLLAFWIVTEPSDYAGANLAILNTETDKVTNYCIQGDPSRDTETSLANVIDPLWSPDGSQLLVVSGNEIVLVDLTNNYAAKIGENEIPVGWMVSQ